MDQVVSSSHIRHRLVVQFSGYGGTALLARNLGVTGPTAAGILKGDPDYSLVKAAAYLGFVPAQRKDEWIKVQGRIDPRAVGYQRWTKERLKDLRRRTETIRNMAEIARQIEVSPDSVRSAVRRYRIQIVGGAA